MTPPGSGGGAALSAVQRTPVAALPPPVPRPAPRSFTVVGAGDVLLHAGLWRQAQQDAGGRGYDFAPLFANVRPVIEGADLAICHLETPVGAPNGPFTGYPVFKVPPQVVPALKATGYDACSTASNHSPDGGEDGLRRTLNALDAAGMAHAGTARSAQEQARPVLVNANGVTVGLVSVTFSFNGMRRPSGKPWLAELIDVDRIRQSARRARAAGAEVVILSVHWGTEYQHDPNRQQYDVARQLLAGPEIDLVLGHHAHVVQPFAQISGKWVAYGHGNHVSFQHFSQPTRDGVISRFTFTESGPGVFRVTKAEALPTYMRLGSGPARVFLVSDCPRSLASACRASAVRTNRVLRAKGAGKNILTIVQ